MMCDMCDNQDKADAAEYRLYLLLLRYREESTNALGAPEQAEVDRRLLEELVPKITPKVFDEEEARVSQAVAGALFCFGGYLTTLPDNERVTFSAACDSNPAAYHIQRFAQRFRLDLRNPDMSRYVYKIGDVDKQEQ
jgi:hypothetical protein